jgi:hypothetical protein
MEDSRIKNGSDRFAAADYDKIKLLILEKHMLVCKEREI